MLVWYQLLNVPAWSLYLVHFKNFRPAWSWYWVLFKTFKPAWSWYWWEYGQGWSQPGPGIGSFLELSYQLGPGIGMDTDKGCIAWSWCWVLCKTFIPTWSWFFLEYVQRSNYLKSFFPYQGGTGTRLVLP